MNIEKYEKSKFVGKIQETVRMADGFRSDKDNPVDASFIETAREQFEDDDMTMDSFLADIGIDPSVDTIENIYTVGQADVSWIIPEIFREAILTGLRTSPIWNAITASEQQLDGLKAIMPHINMSDATPKRTAEGETISLGTISYGQKEISLWKMARGIKITYEVKKYVSLDVVSIFLRDFGVKLGHGLDVLAINTLINGEQSDGSESAPIIGVTTPGTKAYRDMLRIWIRMSRLGRTPNVIIGSETSALDTLDMDEFKLRQNSGPTEANLDLKTPVPNSASYFIHGNVPADQEIMVDPSMALVKFNSVPLMLESEKIVSNQTEAFYVSLTTGFAKIMSDSVLILDKSVDFATDGFPDYLDADAAQNVLIG